MYLAELGRRRGRLRGFAPGSPPPSCSGSAFLVLQGIEYREKLREIHAAHGRVRVALLHDHRPARRPCRSSACCARMDAVLRLARRVPPREARRGADVRPLLALRPCRLAVPVRSPSTCLRGCDRPRRHSALTWIAVIGRAARLGVPADRRLRVPGGGLRASRRGAGARRGHGALDRRHQPRRDSPRARRCRRRGAQPAGARADDAADPRGRIAFLANAGLVSASSSSRRSSSARFRRASLDACDLS